MTDAEFSAACATMPWQEIMITTGRHTLMQMIDNQGREVPLLTMLATMARLSQQVAATVARKREGKANEQA